MDDIENIPWTEESLSALKYRDLKKIAKKKRIVFRNGKKVDLIRTLIESSLQPNSEEFSELKSLEIISADKEDISTPKPTTPLRRLTFSTGKKNYWLRNKFKKSSPDLDCVIPEQEEKVDGQSRNVADLDIKTINTHSERRSTFSIGKKNQQLRSSSRYVSPILDHSEQEEKIDRQSKIVTDVDKEAISTPKCTLSNTDRRLAFSSGKKENELRSSSRNTTPIFKNFISKQEEEVDRQLKNTTDDDKEAINTPNVTSSDRKFMFSTGKKISGNGLKSSSKNTSPIFHQVQEEAIRQQSATVTDIQENCTTETIIEQRSSLKSGIVGEGRRSTYSKDNIDIQDNCTTETIIEQRSSLKSGMVSERRGSTYSKDNKDIQENCMTEAIIERRCSLKSGIVGEGRRSTYSEEDKEIQENCMIETIVEPRNSLKSGIMSKERRSNILKEDKENDPLIIDQDMTNSFIENEEESLIRVTPFRRNTSALSFKKSEEKTESVGSQQNDGLVARVSPILMTDKPLLRKKGVTFQPYDKLDKGSTARVTPRKTIIKTPHKVKELSTTVSSVRKMPNFSAIHKKKFKKMESLVDMKKRFADKARRMLCSPDVPRCAFVNKNGTPRPSFKMDLKATPKAVDSSKKLPRTTSMIKTPSSTKINRFGFKQRLTKNDAKQIISRDIVVHSENKKEEKREILQGVRLNRRFTLQMQARGLHQ